MAEQWDRLFTLPNLAIPVPSPFERDGYVICSGDDPRFNELVADAGNATAAKMLTQFRTARGRELPASVFPHPSEHSREEARRRSDPGIPKRVRSLVHNVGVRGRPRVALRYAAQWRTHWSDQFKFGYFIAGQSGSSSTTRPSFAMNSRLDRARPGAR
jgi:hypothetical protein